MRNSSRIFSKGKPRSSPRRFSSERFVSCVCALLCYLHSAIFFPTCDAETAFTPLHFSFAMACSTKTIIVSARGDIASPSVTVAVFVLERTFSSLARNRRVERRMNRTRESVGEVFGPQIAPRSLLGVPPTIDHRQARPCDGERRSHGARESFEQLVDVRRRRDDREKQTNVSSIRRTAKLCRRPSESNSSARQKRSESQASLRRRRQREKRADDTARPIRRLRRIGGRRRNEAAFLRRM